MKSETEKVTVSLPKETLWAADANRERLGFDTRSAFVDAAIREFISRDRLKEFTGELAQFYQKIEHSEIKNMEDHIAKLSYKIAVQIAQMELLLVSTLELPYVDTRELRGRAIQMVNKCKGYVPLDMVRDNQIEFQGMDAEDDG